MSLDLLKERFSHSTSTNKKEVDNYRETYNNEDANIINKLMNKIITIQEKYKDESDY